MRVRGTFLIIVGFALGSRARGHPRRSQLLRKASLPKGGEGGPAVLECSPALHRVTWISRYAPADPAGSNGTSWICTSLPARADRCRW